MDRFLFVHIAKAAGSSVNKFFEDSFGKDKCSVHLESTPFTADKTYREEIIHGSRYISGHVTYDQFKNLLDINQFFTFTMLRHPYEHVISHVAWIRKLAEPKEKTRFEKHPMYIQNLAIKLANTDLSSSEAVSSLIGEFNAEEWTLLDNTQVRYLRDNAGARSTVPQDVDSSIENLSGMDFFGFVEKSEECFKHLSEVLGMFSNSDFPSENRLSIKYGMSPDNAALMQAFKPIIEYDVKLYEEACKLYRRRIEGGFKNTRSTNGRVLGCVDRASQGVVSGWAKFESSDDVVPLDIAVNGVIYDSFMSGRYRPDLAEKFGVNCAFHYILDVAKVSADDVVDVFVSGTNRRLNNSPLKYSEG